MAKVIMKDGTVECMSPREARAVAACGDGELVETYHTYSTRQLVAEPVKAKRKRRTKAEIEADKEEEEAVDETASEGESDCEAD